MNDRIRPINTGSVQLARQSPITRHDRLIHAVIIALLGAGLIAVGSGLVIGFAPAARSQVRPAPPVCQMTNTTQGFCGGR